ncbi:APO domain-containing protein, partial [Cynara cardunculus var. scolymus]
LPSSTNSKTNPHSRFHELEPIPDSALDGRLVKNMEHVLNLGGSSPTMLGSFSSPRQCIASQIAYKWSYQSMRINDRLSSLFFDKCRQCTHELHGPQTSRTSIFACQMPARDIRYSKKRKKKPYPIPLKKILEASRADKKLAEMGKEKPLEPPKNGLLVPDLVPVAYEVLDAWKILIKGVSQLLHVIPVHAC